jgi:hypothetical protein
MQEFDEELLDIVGFCVMLPLYTSLAFFGRLLLYLVLLVL